MVYTDKQPFKATTSFMEAGYYNKKFGPIKFTRRRKDGVLRKENMESKGFVETQKEAAKLLKVTTIMLYKPTNGPIIKEIDDD